jgi:hypothetical protein
MSDGLLPSVEPADIVRIDRELPEEARTWGRIVDLSALEPGDLLLFREVPKEGQAPDDISDQIVKAQEVNFASRHAQWTHAAVYLGDDEHICEANFKIPGAPPGVNIRSAFTYCDGSHAIRARRPKNMTPKQRLRIAIGALSNLGASYDFTQIISFANAAHRGRGFWKSLRRVPAYRTQSFVCSTFYQDAYNFAFQGDTLRMGMPCTPAHLSASTDFGVDEPPLRWLKII